MGIHIGSASFVATYCFVPPFRKRNSVVCPHEAFLKFGVPWTKKKGCGTLTYTYIHTHAHTGWKVIISMIMSKKCHMGMCPILNGYGDTAV
jgi:hypothetical protein